jgi:hypothetical protein
MSYPSISILLSGTGITAILFVTNWFVWRLSEMRNFRLGRSAVGSTSNSVASGVVGAKELDDSGFKRVA